MGFTSGFVASLIVDNKPVRELNEEGKRTARVPFGSEYKVRLKNTLSKRALASVYIDGTNVTSAGKIILQPYQSLDLERFLVDVRGGNKFKFVEASDAEVQDPTSSENGHVQVVFEEEMTLVEQLLSLPSVTTSFYHVTPTIGPSCSTGPAGPVWTYSTNVTNGTNHSGVTNTCASVGATIEGAASCQEFSSTAAWFSTKSPVTIDIWIRGPKVETAKEWTVKIRTDAPCELWYQGKKLVELSTMSITSKGLNAVSNSGVRFELEPNQWELATI